MENKFEILVVDDDLKNIQVGINFLKQNENYHLVFATSGQQALDRVKEKEFDLVLLDIIMPVMDGYEVCRRLKADPTTKNIPVIFLTAKHEADSLMKGFELGGADYITKPFNAPELNARVRTHLELHDHYKKEIAKLQELLACAQRTETIRFIAGGITHDCNNFISSISPSVYMLQAQLAGVGINIDPYRDLFDGINKAATKVTDLLSTFSRFSISIDTDREVVDLNEVIADLKKVCKGALSHRIDFTTHLLRQPALVFANKLHVEQVLLNMLINAQHAILARQNADADKGRITITIENAIETLGEDPEAIQQYICISVEDNGIGMPPEVLPKIFDQYFTTRKDKGGSGLGLAVSQSIILSHAGHIRVDSEVGRGAKFRVFLPYYAE